MVPNNKTNLSPAEKAMLEYAAAGTETNSLTTEDVLNALAELGELFAAQDDAIVELAEMISE